MLNQAGYGLRIIGGLHEPKRAGDVGYDVPVEVRRERQTWYDRLFSLFTESPVYVIWPFRMRSISSGVRMSMQQGTWCKIEARSSCREARLLVAGGGVIDWGYQGELFAVLLNFGFWPRIIKSGERYVQAVFYPVVYPYPIERVEEFTAVTERGTAGFGSTGR